MKTPGKLHKTRQQLQRWDTEDLQVLWEFLTDLLHERHRQAVEPIPVTEGREVVEERPHKGGTLRLEFVKCGKDTCHCRSSRGHGPYWYAYERKRGKLTSCYIGKTL